MDAKEASFYTTVLIITSIVGIIIIYFVISIVRQQRRSLALYRRSLLTEMTTLERERRRIASDLHDEIGPVLSAIKLKISSFELPAEADQEEATKTEQQIDALIQRMREVSFDLMPTTLVNKGLVPALQEFINYCNRGNQKMEILLQVPEEGIELNEQQSVNLYRMAQEIIHNAMKYSQASQLKLQLRKEKNQLIFSSSDNGTGFNYQEQLAGSGGLGLRNLLSRAEIMGGKMYIESKKGKGTEYLFEIPINHD